MKTTVIIIFLIQGIYCQYIPSCKNYVSYERDAYQANGIIKIPDKGYAKAQIIVKYVTRIPVHQSLQLLKPIKSNGKYLELYVHFHPYVYNPIIYEVYINGAIICSENMYYQYGWIHEQFFYYKKIGDTHENYVTPYPRVHYPGPTRGTITPSTKTTISTSTTTEKSTTTTPTTTTTSTTTPRPTTIVPPFNDAFCGYQSFNPFILGGRGIELNEFPWLVAMIYFNITRRPQYKCAATLISRTHAITAAHCVVNMTETTMFLEFGRYNMSRSNEEGLVRRWINSIISYPGYVLNTADNDIAVLSFDSIQYTTQIQPICIWNDTSTPITNGTISGWGDAYNDGSISMIPRKVELEAVSLEMCRNAHVSLKMLATDRTFCAGGNLVGPCFGDSGSGFYVQQKNRWFLRGIISTGIGDTNLNTCDLSFYTVYVDVAHYIDWIRDSIQTNSTS